MAQAADTAGSGYSSTTSTCPVTPRTIGGTSRSTTQYLPSGTASAVMVLQHGFSRKCSNLRGTSRAIAAKGVMVVCVDADMSGGNPVADAGFSTAVSTISDGGRRPVLSVAARPSLTNLYNNSFGALTALDNPFVGIQLVWTRFTFGWPTGGSCHVDVEGEDTDALGTMGAGCSPNATQTARLRDLGSTWARDLATGTRTSAYWCGDANVVSTCGSVIRDLVDRPLPLAVPVR